MRILCSLFFSLIFFSCDKDDNIQYPKSYIYKETIHPEEGLYVVIANDHAMSIPVTAGTYGQNRQTFKENIAENMREILDIHLIELLDEHSIHLHLTYDEEELDTVLSYTLEEKEMLIEGLPGIQLFDYNAAEDQFELCAQTQFAIAGPGVHNPGQEYHIFYTNECLEDYELDDYLATMLGNFSYTPSDTLGIFITKLIYK